MSLNPNALYCKYNDVVDIDDLQKMLKIGRSSAYEIVKNGRIKTVKIGKRYIIPKQSVIEFLNTAS